MDRIWFQVAWGFSCLNRVYILYLDCKIPMLDLTLIDCMESFSRNVTCSLAL